MLTKNSKFDSVFLMKHFKITSDSELVKNSNLTLIWYNFILMKHNRIKFKL